MTAVYVPEGIAPPAIIAALGARGELASSRKISISQLICLHSIDIVIAGGLHKDIKAKVSLPSLGLPGADQSR